MEKLKEYFFSNDSINRLGIIRIALIGFSIHDSLPYIEEAFQSFAGQPNDFLERPTFLKLFGLGMPAMESLILSIPIQIIGILTCVGLATRFMAGILFFIYSYFGALDAAAGHFDHAFTILSVVSLLVCFAPGGSSWSLDNLLFSYFRREKKVGFINRWRGASQPIWGSRLVIMFSVLVLFAAGFSKLRHGGFKWFNGKTLEFSLKNTPQGGFNEAIPAVQFAGSQNTDLANSWRDGYGIESYVYLGWKKSSLGLWLENSPFFLSVFSVGTVLIELLAPLALVGGWLGSFVLLQAILMHLGIFYTMELPFFEYMIVEFLFLDFILIGKFLAKFLSR